MDEFVNLEMGRLAYMRFSGEPFGVESMYMIGKYSGRKEARKVSFAATERSFM